jgi:hypothetical protein
MARTVAPACRSVVTADHDERQRHPALPVFRAKVAAVALPVCIESGGASGEKPRSGWCRRLCKTQESWFVVAWTAETSGILWEMAPRPLTEAALLKQLKTVGEKIAGTVSGEKRLALLRRQADLGDQRDEAADKRRKAK